jgi:hypothetical protein
MLRIIEETKYGVFGFAGGTSDVGINGASLPKGKFRDKTIATTSYALNVETDEYFIFNETTQTWILKD